ncbi:MAG: amidase family protein [Acidimicrobiales bacterium]
MARTVDDLLLLLEVLAAPDPRDPLHRTVDCQSARQPVERPLRVAYSSSLGGLPVEADVSAVIATVPEWLTSMGWEVVDAEPDMGGVDERFETIRAWYYANGPLGALGERLSEAKAVLGDEVARGRALSAADVWQAQSHLTVLWRRAVEFFTDIDLLVAPVSQVSPFPVEWEYPTEVAGCTMGRYLEWMRSCSRVTMFGLPGCHSRPASRMPAFRSGCRWSARHSAMPNSCEQLGPWSRPGCGTITVRLPDRGADHQAPHRGRHGTSGSGARRQRGSASRPLRRSRAGAPTSP